MDDIGYIVFTNNDILKQITKWHILEYLNDRERLINILCQDKNMDHLIWLLYDKYITTDTLNSATTEFLSKLNYFSQKPLFLDYAYFANSPKITTYFKYDTKYNMDLNKYMQNVFENLQDNKNFISFYNYLPKNNLFDNHIYDYEHHKLKFNDVINNNLFYDMNNLSFNRCLIAGDFGTQYDLKELHYNDNLLKFLLKSGLITLDILDGKFIDYNKCNLIRSSIVYMMYKNLSKTLEYVLHEYPKEKTKLVDGFSSRIMEFLFRQNIEIIIVLLKINIPSLDNYILEYLFKYMDYNLAGPLGKSIHVIINTFNELNIYPYITELIKENKINEMKKIHEYVSDNKLNYKSGVVNAIIMCYTPKFIEHFNTLDTKIKNECMEYLLKNEPKLISKIINDNSIDISFQKKINILIKNNMYDFAFDYITHYDYNKSANKIALMHLTNPSIISDIILDIKKLFDYIETDIKKEQIYESLNKLYISKNMINFIFNGKLVEWNKICKEIFRDPLKYINLYIDIIIKTNNQAFSKIYEGFSNERMEEDIKNKLIANITEPKKIDGLELSNFEVDKKSYNVYECNKLIHNLFCNYCAKNISEIIDNYIICYTPEFVEHFKTLSIDTKNRCLKYLLDNNEHNLISKIIFDSDIIIDVNTKLKILLENKMYDDTINYILLNDCNNDEYINLENKYNEQINPKEHTILNGVFTQGDKRILTFFDETLLINSVLNEPILPSSIQNLLTYIYKNENKYDIKQFLKKLHQKISIDDLILIIKNLPKSLNNFYDIFTLLCDILVEKIIMFNKMLYCIKNTTNNKINEDEFDINIDDDNNIAPIGGLPAVAVLPPIGGYAMVGPPAGGFAPMGNYQRHIKKEVDINDFASCIETFLSVNNIQNEKIIKDERVPVESFPTINDTILLIDSGINFVDSAYKMLLQNDDVINFVNEYSLGNHLNKFTNNTYSNYIIKNIVIQNLLNVGRYDKNESITYKFLHMTSNIYKKNSNNINNIVNNVIIPDHNMLTIVYNYSKSLIKNFNTQLYELQIFLQSIQDIISDDDIYNNFSFNENNYEKLCDTNYLLEYFIKNNMPKCLNAYLNNDKVKYYDHHIRMSNKSELLNILKKNKSSHIKEYMPLTLLVKIQ